MGVEQRSNIEFKSYLYSRLNCLQIFAYIVQALRRLCTAQANVSSFKSHLATERTEETQGGIVLRREGVEFGVVDQTGPAERVQTRQSFGLVVW